MRECIRRILYFLLGAMDPEQEQPMGARLGLLCLRLAFGAGIAYHGFAVLSSHEAMAKFGGFVGNMGFPMPVVFAYISKLTEFCGGLCILLGLLTRPAAFFLVFNMSVAAFVALWHAPLMAHGAGAASKEVPLAYLVPFLTLFCAGPGLLALDNLFAGFWHKRFGQEPKQAGA